jgi:uncharacterized membrane protein YdbT with pleckstrin-like domain
MPFPTKLLNDDEEIAVDLHPHWLFFAKAVAWLVAAIIFGIVALSIGGSVGTTLQWIALAAVLITAAMVGHRYLQWTSTNFVVTNDRVIYRSGVITKRGIEIPLERVNTVHFNQGVFERMTGTGDLLIESGGEEGQQRFTDIRHPDAVQNVIHHQMDVNEQRRRGNYKQPAATTDVATQLEKLEGMLQRGTLTQAEFDAQKQRLLGG